MICPNCSKTPLIIQKNNYFCPSCQIYIGPANKPIPNFSTNATSRWQTNPNPKLEAISDNASGSSSDKINPEINNFPIKKIVTFALVVIFLSAIFIFLNNVSNYISLLNFCSIKIEQSINSKKDEIIQSLDYLKDQDFQSYQDTCKYIDKISERTCTVSDLRGSGGGNAVHKEYCYVKGSKVIYIAPKYNSSVAQRASLIAKLAGFSKEYWINK